MFIAARPQQASHNLTLTCGVTKNCENIQQKVYYF